MVILLSTVCASGQEGETNRLDGNGQKTGVWKKYYDNGNLMYEGNFENGQPVGMFIRYYEGGIKKAEMDFRSGGKISYARLYYENGDLAAVGKYEGQLKDSIWDYYSFYNRRLALTEGYRMGKKYGFSIKYYDDGKVAEKLEYKDDIMHGTWEQYFENGIPRLICRNVDGKMNGAFVSFNPDSTYSITGTFDMGKMIEKWTYYTENNEIDIVLEYVDGVMIPNPEFEARQKEFSKLLENRTRPMDEPDSVFFR